MIIFKIADFIDLFHSQNKIGNFGILVSGTVSEKPFRNFHKSLSKMAISVIPYSLESMGRLFE